MLNSLSFLSTDFGALFSGGGGGAGGGGNGANDDGNVFHDTMFAVIFAVSWFLILLVVVSIIALFVVYSYVPQFRDLVSGKRDRSKTLAKNRARRASSFARDYSGAPLDSLTPLTTEQSDVVL